MQVGAKEGSADPGSRPRPNKTPQVVASDEVAMKWILIYSVAWCDFPYKLQFAALTSPASMSYILVYHLDTYPTED